MLTASGLAKSHGTRTLFRNVSLSLSPGRRTALVGGNGAGKTTLLEILAGLQQPDEGEIHRSKGFTLGYLPQELATAPDTTVLDEVLLGAGPITELAHRLRDLEGRLATTTGAEHEQALAHYGEAQSRFEQLGGYAIESEAERVLSGLGFEPRDSDRPVAELSGGWRMRVALARLLLAQPDVLLLDEPTNHLDVDSVAWLEQHLASTRSGLLFVSHARDFIDNVAERVIELAGGVATEYVGGFAEFVVQREERIEREAAAAANQAREIADVERFIERFRYKASKARQVQSRIKTLEKLERLQPPTRKELVARFAFPPPPRSSRVVAELVGATIGYDGQPVLRDVDLVVERGRKVALVGPNGAGKTTLLRALLGELAADSGSVTTGTNLIVASFAQDQAEVLDPDKTAYQEFASSIADPGKRNLRTVLGSFGFPGDAADRRVGDLSGGERTRLALAKTMTLPANLLVLDEPTNHLDLPSCDVLEDALTAYPGTVLLVTHDRYLIRSIADALIEIRNGTARWHEGAPEEVLTPRVERAEVAPARAKRPDARAERRRAAARERDSSRSATKRVRDAERAWERAEAAAASLAEQLADPDIYDDHQRVSELADRHSDAQQRATRLLGEWEAALADLEATESGRATDGGAESKRRQVAEVERDG